MVNFRFRTSAVWMAAGFGLLLCSGFSGFSFRAGGPSAYAQTEEPVAAQTSASSTEEPTAPPGPQPTEGKPTPVPTPKPAIEVPVGINPSFPPDSTQYLETLSDLLVDLRVSGIEVKQNGENLDVLLSGTGTGTDGNFLLFVQNETVVQRMSFSGFPASETGEPSQATLSVPLNQLKPGNLDIWVGYREKLGKRYIVSAEGSFFLENQTGSTLPKESAAPTQEVVKTRPAGKKVEQPKKSFPKKEN